MIPAIVRMDLSPSTKIEQLYVYNCWLLPHSLFGPKLPLTAYSEVPETGRECEPALRRRYRQADQSQSSRTSRQASNATPTHTYAPGRRGILPKTVSSGSQSCIGSKPSCAAVNHRLDSPGGGNDQRRSLPPFRAGFPITVFTSRQSPNLQSLVIHHQVLGRSPTLPGRRSHRDRQQQRRANHPADCTEPEECTVCGPRCRSRELGDHRIAHRDL